MAEKINSKRRKRDEKNDGEPPIAKKRGRKKDLSQSQESNPIAALKSIAAEDIMVGEDSKSKKTGVQPEGENIPKFEDSRQQLAAAIEAKRQRAFRGYGTFVLIGGEVNLKFGYNKWNERPAKLSEARDIVDRMKKEGVLWMLYPMPLIVDASELDFTKLTPVLSKAPSCMISWSELARARGSVDSVGGQHRKLALEILHKETWDKDIALSNTKAAEAKRPDVAARHIAAAEEACRHKSQNVCWVGEIYERGLVDDELGLSLGSNQERKSYKASELEIVNTELFSVVRADPEERDAAKLIMLQNVEARKLRFATYLRCPEFFDFLTTVFELPGLRYCPVFLDAEWIRSSLFPVTGKSTTSAASGVLMHLFLIMHKQMLAISTEDAADSSSNVRPTPVPEIWNRELLDHLDQIYSSTLHPVIEHDGIFTPEYKSSWREYKKQVAQCMLDVFGDGSESVAQSNPATNAYGRASLWMYRNILSILPDEILESALPWPLLTQSVFRDFTKLFRNVDEGLHLYTHIVEGHWGNPHNMSSNHQDRFFDGSIVIFRHLNNLPNVDEARKLSACHEFATHMRLNRPSKLARMQFLAQKHHLLPHKEFPVVSEKFSLQVASAASWIGVICKRDRQDERVVSILPTDYSISPEIAVCVGSLHKISPTALKNPTRDIHQLAKNAVINTSRVLERTLELVNSATYCEEREWIISLFSRLKGEEYHPWDGVTLPPFNNRVVENNTIASIEEERSQQAQYQKALKIWQSAVKNLLSLPMALDADGVMTPVIFNAIMEIHQAFSAHSTNTWPKAGQPWCIDFGGISIPSCADVNENLRAGRGEDFQPTNPSSSKEADQDPYQEHNPISPLLSADVSGREDIGVAHVSADELGHTVEPAVAARHEVPSSADDGMDVDRVVPRMGLDHYTSFESGVYPEESYSRDHEFEPEVHADVFDLDSLACAELEDIYGTPFTALDGNGKFYYDNSLDISVSNHYQHAADYDTVLQAIETPIYTRIDHQRCRERLIALVIHMALSCARAAICPERDILVARLESTIKHMGTVVIPGFKYRDYFQNDPDTYLALEDPDLNGLVKAILISLGICSLSEDSLTQLLVRPSPSDALIQSALGEFTPKSGVRIPDSGLCCSSREFNMRCLSLRGGSELAQKYQDTPLNTKLIPKNQAGEGSAPTQTGQASTSKAKQRKGKNVNSAARVQKSSGEEIPQTDNKIGGPSQPRVMKGPGRRT